MSSTIPTNLPTAARTGATAGDDAALRLPRAMYALNLVAAGLPGAVITFAPEFARTQMFAGDPEPMTLGILGSVWLAIGVVSVLGLRDPRRWQGVFAVQAVYKTVWIATGATALLPGRSDVWPYAIGFGVAVIGFAGALVALREGRR